MSNPYGRVSIVTGIHPAATLLSNQRLNDDSQKAEGTTPAEVRPVEEGKPSQPSGYEGSGAIQAGLGGHPGRRGVER